MKGRGFLFIAPRSSSSFLQREARAYDAPLVGNFAPVFAYDPGREGQAQPRAARETFERVVVRVGRKDAAPLYDRRRGRSARLFPAQSNFLAALRGQAP